MSAVVKGCRLDLSRGGGLTVVSWGESSIEQVYESIEQVYDALGESASGAAPATAIFRLETRFWAALLGSEKRSRLTCISIMLRRRLVLVRRLPFRFVFVVFDGF